LPWFVAIGVTSDWAFYREAVGGDFLGKMQGGQEKHWGPPGFYFVLFWWSFWPAALVATGGAALWLWRNRKRRRVLFLLAWTIPFWLVLEATPTKLPHYAMVYFPAIAMGAAWVLRDAVLTGELRQRTYKQGAALWLLIALLQLGVLGFALVYFKVVPSVWFWPLAAGSALLAYLTARAAWDGQFHGAIAMAILTALLLYTAAFRFVLPSLDGLWMSRQAIEIVGALRRCVPGEVALTRYREPSAIFRLGTATPLMTVEEAPEALRTGKAAYALIPAENGSLPAGETPPRPVACINGFNINGGKHLRMQIVTLATLEALAACPVPERYRCGP
jgi:4-amino-4-deoxy-L-arabinose transferase-like glycosyltransferase